MTYLESVLKRFRDYKSLGDKTFEQLTDEEMVQEPNTDVNSIAVIVQHMHGNMLSRWTNFLTEDGEKEWRQRDDEFEEHKLSKEKILALWEEGWTVVLNTISSLAPGDLDKTIYIRSQPLTALDAINRQFAHYSYHVGQIVLLGKWMKGNQWKSLSIPKGASDQYNRDLMHPLKS